MAFTEESHGAWEDIGFGFVITSEQRHPHEQQLWNGNDTD
jgi:hypothetical protein